MLEWKIFTEGLLDILFSYSINKKILSIALKYIYILLCKYAEGEIFEFSESEKKLIFRSKMISVDITVEPPQSNQKHKLI